MFTALIWLAFSTLKLVHAGAYMEEPLINAAETLKCHRVPYKYSVTQTDANGKQCWDELSVMACWGRCDSKEISDWRFPFKKSNHPVCVHYGRNRAFAILRNCDDGVLEGTDRYEYLEADGCKCQLCSSSDTSCEGLRFRQSSESIGFNMVKK